MYKKLLCVLTVFLALSVKCYSDDTDYLIQNPPESSSMFLQSNNFRVLPDTITQVETSIAVHPLNPMIVAGASVTDVYAGGYTTGVYLSTNGGANWQGKQAIKDSTGLIISTVGNPKITIDKNGTLMVVYIAPNPLGGNAFKIGVSYSTNNGLYWSRTVYVPGTDTADKCSITTDCIPSSQYYGNSYVVYNERRGIYFSSTSNGGKSWTQAKRISPPTYYQRTGASVAVGNGGEVYITWPYTPQVNKYIGFARSTNGGVTWDSSDTKIPVTPLNTDFRINLNLVKLHGLPVITADNSGGERNGWLYIVASERADNVNPAQDSCDLIIHCSTDKGLTWPMMYRVNQDIGTYKHQFFPAINVDNSGRIEVLYYDNRNTPTRDTFQVYMSYSENGGQTFEDVLVSDHKFRLKQLVSSKWLFGIPSYIGTGIGIASSNIKALPFWYDNFVNDEYQAWITSVSFYPDSYIKSLPQGFYNSGSMTLNSKDTAKVYLRNSNSPYAIADSAYGIIDSVSFITKLVFKNAIAGNYYINFKHRNSIEIWSSSPVNYNLTAGLNYDFTNSSSKAYGNNLVINSGNWCMYSGDVNQDGIVDIGDIALVENDAFENAEGYLNADVTGDKIVDTSDIMYVENNSTESISVVKP